MKKETIQQGNSKGNIYHHFLLLCGCTGGIRHCVCGGDESHHDRRVHGADAAQRA